MTFRQEINPEEEGKRQEPSLIPGAGAHNAKSL
jgi:hypothetical protein